MGALAPRNVGVMHGRPGPVAIPAFLTGGGEMGERIRAHDWSATPLGLPPAWPAPLSTLVSVMLGSQQPMFLAWGPERALIYNDGYAGILGAKHPEALGRPLLDVWSEIRGDLQPLVERVDAGGSVQMDDITLRMERHGYPEETHFAFSYTPVRDKAGQVVGLFCPCQETTSQVLAERALRAERDRSRAILAGMAEGFGLLDRDFRVLEINAEGLRLEERPASEIVGKTHWEAWPGSEESELGRLYRRAMRERAPATLEHRYNWPDGRAAWIEVRAYPSGDGLALFYRDVTERKRTEEALRESEDHYRHAVELNPQTVWTAGPDGRLDRVGRRWTEWTGTSGLGSSWGDVIHPEDHPASVEAWTRSVTSGASYDIEHRVRMRDGAYRWMRSRAYPRLEPDGRIVKWHGTTEDIHDKKLVEDALRESETRLSAILSQASAGIASTDGAGRFTFVNERFCHLLERSRADLLGLSMQDVTHPDDLPANLDKFVAAVNGGPAFEVEKRYVRPDGTSVWVRNSVTAIRDAGGRFMSVLAVSVDLTDRKTVEDRLRESEARFRNMADHAPVMMWVTDPDGFCTYLNRRWYAFTGQSEAEAEGFGWLDATHPDDKADAERVFVEANAERVPFRVEYRLRRADGAYRWAIDSASPRFGEDGGYLGYVGSVIDIDERREAEETLRATTARAEALAAEQAAILGQLAEGVIVTDRAGRITFVNEAAARIHGVARLDVEPDAYSETYRLLTMDGQPYPSHELPLARAVLMGETVTEARWRVRRPDGSEVLAVGSARPVLDAGGERLGAVLTLRDDTEREAAERLLRENEARLRALTDNLPSGMVYQIATGRDGSERRFLYVSQSHEKLTGIPAAAVLADPGIPYNLILPEHRPAVVEAEARAIRNRTPFDVQVRFRRADGAVRWSRIISAPRAMPDSSLIWDGIQIDITDQKRAEERLRESETRFRTLADVVPNFVWFAGPDGALHYLNDRWYAYTGQTPEEALPHGWAAVIHPEDAERTAAAWADALAREANYEVECRYRRRDGAHRWYVARAEPLRDQAGRVTAWFGASTDIHDRRAAEDALRELNATLEARVEERTRERDQLWELSEDLLAVADYEGSLLRVSPSWTRLFGYDEATLSSRPYGEIIHPEDFGATMDVLLSMRSSGRSVSFENRVLAADGVWRWIAWTVSPDPGGERLIAVGRDVTAEKVRQTQLEEAQDQLRQAQKMEAVGQLTGGIAHDFNNLLAGIVGSLDLMQTRLAQGRTDAIERYAKAAMSSAQRAAALTHRLLAFSRRQPLDPKPVNANGLVASMEDLIRRTIGPSHALEIVTAGGLWTTLCDPNQLESAILNLSINARDAMPDGGKLTIETCNAHLDDAYAAASRDVTPGQYVCICVTDTGTGMSPDVIGRAFEPFFTTKPLGQGTGLGLSMVYGFAKQSEGHLKIYSEVGQGTTVKIYLPRHRGVADVQEVAGSITEAPRAEAGETVLVVEDEPVIRDLIVEVLEDLGYRALEAADGPSGLKVLQGRERIDLLVTDVGLPGLNGRQLADGAREKRPDLKVLFITGYAENATLANGFLEPGMEMITKPFAVEALAAKITGMIRSR